MGPFDASYEIPQSYWEHTQAGSGIRLTISSFDTTFSRHSCWDTTLIPWQAGFKRYEQNKDTETTHLTLNNYKDSSTVR